MALRFFRSNVQKKLSTNSCGFVLIFQKNYKTNDEFQDFFEDEDEDGGGGGGRENPTVSVATPPKVADNAAPTSGPTGQLASESTNYSVSDAVAAENFKNVEMSAKTAAAAAAQAAAVSAAAAVTAHHQVK